MPRLGTVVYLKPSNIILIVRPENLKSEKAFGARHGLRGEQANVIFEFILGKTSPNAIG